MQTVFVMDRKQWEKRWRTKMEAYNEYTGTVLTGTPKEFAEFQYWIEKAEEQAKKDKQKKTTKKKSKVGRPKGSKNKK